jgi:hypothetical protein
MERTFAIIKPDAVASRKAGQILARIEAAGFTVRAMRLQHLTKKEAEGFYAVHRERPFFRDVDRTKRHARFGRGGNGGVRAGLLLSRSRVDLAGSAARARSLESNMGRTLIVLGLLVAGIGLLMTIGLPIGRLPGDFTIRRGNFTFYFPLASSIIASIVLTLVMMFLGRR